MANELQNLSALFHNRIFRIPDYQRGYAWRHEQLTDFWEDLVNLAEDKHHYTGLLSLKEVKPEDKQKFQADQWLINIGYKLFHVVDGQQRLTTFSILVHQITALLRTLPNNAGKPDEEILLGDETLGEITQKYILRKRPPENIVKTYLFGYETDNPSSDYLKHKIFDEPYGNAIRETYYTKNLENAKSFFKENLELLYKNEGIKGIERLYKKLTLQLKFNLHEIEDEYNVFVAFETMNNRGRRLTNLELLKNRLIYLTTLFENNQLDDRDKEQLRDNINEAWKEIYYQLGRNQAKPLSDDEFLRAHWITYFQYSRKQGDDSLHFLLSKFSAKNIYEKLVTPVKEETPETLNNLEITEDDDLDNEISEMETILESKLKPKEITDYVNSLKELAQYWYYGYFPNESPNLTDEEKEWIGKLNRLGMGYFRPLVATAIGKVNSTTSTERIRLLKAIERFIFLSFRMAGFNTSYRSSEYYSKTRDLQRGNIDFVKITEDLDNSVDKDMPSIIANFTTRIIRRFDTGEGFYGWHGLPYFLYEYENKLSTQYNMTKVDWNLFTRVEKDKVTIEHILPQTSTKWYWRNQFRQYNEEEKKLLSASLGNLLPLAQSINSSLQNDSFPDKKTSSTSGRRGYENGSHSEIEVAHKQDWTAQNILERGQTLLHFLESRWKLKLDDNQKKQLLHGEFVNDRRDELPELEEDENLLEDSQSQSRTTRFFRRRDFWTNFVKYCKSQDRGEDIGRRKPSDYDTYDVVIDRRDYILFFQIKHQKKLGIGIYIYNPDTFVRLEALKNEIEGAYGHQLDWYSSRKKSTHKRILHLIEADVHNQELYPKHFSWLITQFDKLKMALEKTDV